MKKQRIHHDDLPKAALRKMSSRQRSYIDEFSFLRAGRGPIEAWYGGQHLASWDGKTWREPLMGMTMRGGPAKIRATSPAAGGRRRRDPEHVLEIISTSRRPEGTNYAVRVPDPKNKRGYDLVDVLMHHNGAISTNSASRSRTTASPAIRFVKKHIEEHGSFRRDPEATPHFTVSKTYEIVTPESAEEGDVEDRGFEYEKTKMTLCEVIKEIENLGGFDFDTNPITLAEIVRRGNAGASLTLYAMDSHTNYRTGAETSYALHIKGSPRAMKRLGQILIEQRKSRRW